MTNTTKTNERETNLRNAFRKMNADDYQTIRAAYYKAVEGLRTLADALERVDANATGPLLEEHLTACQALDAMNNSLLGRIL